jgi:hypothetical protein
MWGCCNRAAISIPRRKRSGPIVAASSAGNHPLGGYPMSSGLCCDSEARSSAAPDQVHRPNIALAGTDGKEEALPVGSELGSA